MKRATERAIPPRKSAVGPQAIEGEDLVGYGDPRDLDEQIDFALNSLRVAAGYLGAASYGTCQDVKDDEAVAMLVDRAREFLEGLELSHVSVKPRTEQEGE